jgi:hypothetical protein
VNNYCSGGGGGGGGDTSVTGDLVNYCSNNNVCGYDVDD